MTTALIHERLQSQLAFHTEIDKLKRVIRRNSLIDGSRRENDAEHSWHLAMMAMTLAEHAPPGTDMSKVVAMLLVHDIVEIDAGDTFIYDPVAVEGQAALERAAADRIFGLLPDDQGARLRTLWDEFEERRTPEARFARALDRLAPIIANHHNEGGTWPLYKVTAAQVMEKVRLIEEGSPTLGEYAAELVAGSVSRGHLAP
ncbi:putative hydrolases of HD superfamily [Microbispora rosea]|uniref:5'-deoxynucleotidase n=1 Tax=Microbispora rosea TaxID=58117 RepID=A0A1N7G6Q2_9ACTN|nr:HD domain-containing protein [Microbispora rosea]GIH46242.1 hydrolase [Microbispora rosea subsp. rosea]SIS08242.1 putative hydrolases of HD superfamily [Microbispora rosea]